MTTMQQLSDAQASPEVPINENFETLSWAAIFGKRHSATSGLTWGYYGGFWNGLTIADDDVALTGSSTNYVVVDRATGVVSVATTSTNWDNPGGFAKLYKLTTNTTAVTAVEDHRAGPGGVHEARAFSKTLNVSGTTHDLDAADAGRYLRFTNALAKSLTVQDNADEAITVDTEVHGRNVGAGDLTIVEDTAVTVNPPAAGTLVVPAGGTFTLKKIATDEWDLIGSTVPV